MTWIFATYFDRNYAAAGLSMITSLLRHQPEATVEVLALDDEVIRAVEEFLGQRAEVHVRSVATLHERFPELAELLKHRTAWEGFATLKPFYLKSVMEGLKAGQWLCFVDADLYFFSGMESLMAEMQEGSSIGLSPHRFNEVTSHLTCYGEFNAGFALWKKDEVGEACLAGWLQQCRDWCLQEVQPDGRFMDQGYLTGWPGLYQGVKTVGHPGINLAPWNVGSHELAFENGHVLVDGRPLVFFHFSGVLRGRDGVWRTFYTYEAMKQPVLLEHVYRPYLDELEAVSVRLHERFGFSGRGTRRDFPAQMPLLDLPCSTPSHPPEMVWLPSFPRSGNKLARIILTSLFQAPAYTVYEQVGEPDKFPPIATWKGALPEVASDGKQKFRDIFFMKTHELPQTDHPAIYIVRDGRDVYVSYAHFVLQHFPEHAVGMSFEAVLKMLIQSRDHFAGWSAHVRAWTERPARTAVIRFEQMVADPAGCMAAACAWIGVPTPPASGEMPGFGDLKAAEPGQFRNGKAGGWREEMSAELEELFWSIHGDTMQMLGYAR